MDQFERSIQGTNRSEECYLFESTSSAYDVGYGECREENYIHAIWEGLEGFEKYHAQSKLPESRSVEKLIQTCYAHLDILHVVRSRRFMVVVHTADESFVYSDTDFRGKAIECGFIGQTRGLLYA